jgi:hypothetical protein
VKSGPDVFADALVPSAAAADAWRVDFPNFPFAMSQRSRPETRLRRVHRDRQTPFQIWSVMIIPNKPANGVGEQIFNRSAGLQVFNPAPAMECEGAQMVKARLARGLVSYCSLY